MNHQTGQNRQSAQAAALGKQRGLTLGPGPGALNVEGRQDFISGTTPSRAPSKTGTPDAAPRGGLRPLEGRRTPLSLDAPKGRGRPALDLLHGCFDPGATSWGCFRKPGNSVI